MECTSKSTIPTRRIEQYTILKDAANTAAGLTVAGQRALNELTNKFGKSSSGGYTAPWSN